MGQIQGSGFFYPNKFGLIIIKSLEDVMGRNGLNAILNLAGISNYIESYPPDNLEKGFDFAELSAVGSALEEMYGPRGGRGLALRAGRAMFSDVIKNFGPLAGVADLPLAVLPLQPKLRTGLNAFAKMFVQLTDQETKVEERDGELVWTINRCPCCWGRRSEDNPVCYIAAGLLLESLKWISGGNEFRVSEDKCIAVGDTACEFVIQKEPIS